MSDRVTNNGLSRDFHAIRNCHQSSRRTIPYGADDNRSCLRGLGGESGSQRYIHGAGWRSYFTMCPDYWIHTDYVMAEYGVVLAVGEAGGTIDGVSWRTPAAWKAVTRNGKVMEWRVFADNRPVYEILARRQR
jgi:hypothetical protein